MLLEAPTWREGAVGAWADEGASWLCRRSGTLAGVWQAATATAATPHGVCAPTQPNKLHMVASFSSPSPPFSISTSTNTKSRGCW